MESADIILSPTGKVSTFTTCSSTGIRPHCITKSPDAKALCGTNHLNFGQPKNMLENQSWFFQIKKPTMHIDNNNAHAYHRKSIYTAALIELDYKFLNLKRNYSVSAVEACAFDYT